MSTVLVTGGRRFSDAAFLIETLDWLNASRKFSLLVHGGASGADKLAGEWAKARMVPVKVYMAEWSKHGRAAGPIRNRDMLQETPALVVAFPGGIGTANMVQVAREHGIEVIETWSIDPNTHAQPTRNIMSVSLDFDSAGVEPRAAFDAIPAGKYVAVITASEEKPTKKGDGSYLQLTFQVIEGEYENRKLWARLNLNNPNDQAVAIARSELSAICRATGVSRLKNTAELHDIPVIVKVAQRTNPDSGEKTNEIKGYEAKGGNAGTAATKPASQQPSVPPWKKPK